MRFFDVHTHILPGIDDGAKNKEQSLEMIKMLKEQGITDIILTPHYYPTETLFSTFVEKRKRAFDEIAPYFDEYGITPHIGAEVFLIDVLFGLEDISELCIDNTNYLLIELPFNEWNQTKILKSLNKLCANFQVVPIIAHIEKYPAFFKKSFLSEINKMDYFAQIDIDSLKNPFLKRKIKKYIEKGYIQFAGSDCHDTQRRRPNFDVLKQNLVEIMELFLFNNSDITF